MDILRYIATLFGVKFVELIDYDGSSHIRRVWFQGPRARATRVGSGIRNVTLLDDGKIQERGYVHGWRSYKPFSKKVWPKGL